MFKYTHVLTRQVPSTLMNGLCQETPEEPINLEIAENQLEAYNSILRGVISNFIEIPAEHKNPDCVFIEDPVFILGQIAVLNHLGHPSRRSEVEGILPVLKQLGLKIIEMKEPACLDGGDVMVTGKEIIVGLSSRTNEEGVSVLRSGFPNYVVRAIHVAEGLHLKSALSVLDEETLVVSGTTAGQTMLTSIQSPESPIYKIVTVPDVTASNVLRICSTVLVQDGYPESEKILREAIEARGLDMKIVRMSEFVKIDGALTCCSVPLKLNPLEKRRIPNEIS